VIVSLLAGLTLIGCALASTQQDRVRVVELLKSGELLSPPGLERLTLPPEFASASEGGEVVRLREGDVLTVVFFRFRGLNHYTGWVYSDAAVTEDPLGNQPFQARDLGGGWYEVNAG
jgi:hypothetical protein